jgi:hypothetical protein
MKRIALNLPIDSAQNRPKDVIKEIISNSPTKPITVDEMRHRVTIMEALERSTDHLLLEDASHRVLADAMQGFPYSRASRDLLTIIDAVINASSVDVTELSEAKQAKKKADA